MENNALPLDAVAPVETTEIDGEASSATGQSWLAKAATAPFAVPFLGLLCGALFFVNLGGYPIYTKGESREAVTVLGILHGHSISSVILPMRAGVEIPSKPLMMHWLIALCSWLTAGVNEWTVRLPSALLATLAVVACYLYLRRLFDDLIGLFAAILMATTLQFLQAGTGARVDMTLTFFMEIGFFEFIWLAEGLRIRSTVLYLALACAVLAKGPVGLLLPAGVAAVFIILERRWTLLAKLDLVKGAIIIAVLAGGWYLAAIAVGGKAFIDKQILEENIFTFLYQAGVSGGHGHSFYYVELSLLAGFAPWCLLLPVVGKTLAERTNLSNPRVRYLIIWMVTVLLFYNLAYSKRGVYLLSLYPALAAATALALKEAAAREQPPLWLRVTNRCVALVAAGAAGIALVASGLLTVWPALFERMLRWGGIQVGAFTTALAHRVSSDLLSVAGLIALLAIIAWQVWRYPATVARLIGGGCAAIAALAIAANLFVVPAIANTLSLKDFSFKVEKVVEGHSAAYLYFVNYDVAFYTGMVIPVRKEVSSAPPDYVITSRDTYAALHNSGLRGYSVVLQSGPTDFDNSGVMVLLGHAVGSVGAAGASPAL